MPQLYPNKPQPSLRLQTFNQRELILITREFEFVGTQSGVSSTLAGLVIALE